MKTFTAALALAALALTTAACDYQQVMQLQAAPQGEELPPPDDDHKCPVYSTGETEQPTSPSCPAYPWYKTL